MGQERIFLMEKKKVYVLIKMLCKEENKTMQERVAFIFFNTSALDEIREDVTFLNRGTPRTFTGTVETAE